MVVVMKLWLPFLLAVLVIAAAPVAESPAWKAGAAAAKITPEKSMWMAGYAARTKPSEGVELDLFAKALVIEDQDGAKFALITMDLIGVPRNLRLAVSERVKKDSGSGPPISRSMPRTRTADRNCAQARFMARTMWRFERKKRLSTRPSWKTRS